MQRTARLIPIFAVFVILWLSLFIYQKHLQYQVKKKTGIVTPEGIDSLEKIALGGIDQWILLRGWDRSNPVLLFLHGGPGAPLFTYAREIGVKAKLEQHFVMVYWEQRGTGKSFNSRISAESMTLEQFFSDTYELVEILRDRFKVPKIFLVGRSWGTVLGMFTVKRHPELFYAYVGIGQIINSLENDKISYQFTLETAARLRNAKASKELAGIGPPPYDYEKLIIQRKWLTKFSEIVLAEKTKQIPMKSSARMRLLSTPEYSLIDILRMGIDPYFSIKHLWNEEFYGINLVEQIPAVELPVFFLAGRYDYFTPSEIVEQYYQRLRAPEGKDMIWFEHSGHELEFDEPEKFYNIMANKVLEKGLDNR